MNDLNKTPKTLHTSLDGTVKEVEKLDTRESDEIFKAIANDMELIKKCKRSWTMTIAVELLIDTFIPIGMMIEKSSSIWGVSYFWDVIIPFVAALMFLLLPPGKGHTFTNGKPIRIKGQIPKKIIYFILAVLPWYFCIVIRFDVDPVKALWITPISFIAILINAKYNLSGRTGVYSEDYRSVRICQSEGGLNPDALPPVFMNAENKAAIMRMTPQDWNRIGHQLRQAGYKNVLKKGR